MIIFEFLIIAINLHLAFSGTEGRHNYCPNYNSQNPLDVKKILGKWEVIEIIYHNKSGLDDLLRNETNNKTDDVLPILEIREDVNKTLWYIERNNCNSSTTVKRRIMREATTDDLIILRPDNYEKKGYYNDFAIRDIIQISNSNYFVIMTVCHNQNLLSLLLAKTNNKPLAEFIRKAHDVLQKRKLDIAFFKASVTADDYEVAIPVPSAAELKSEYVLYFSIIWVVFFNNNKIYMYLWK